MKLGGVLVHAHRPISLLSRICSAAPMAACMGMGRRPRAVPMAQVMTVLIPMRVFLVVLMLVLVDFFGIVVNHRRAVVVMPRGGMVVVVAAGSYHDAGHAYPYMHIHIGLGGRAE